MIVRPSRIELFPPVHRGAIVATIHVFVCLLAASVAAAAPSDHYFSYLFIDFLQNESFLLGYFVALSSCSVVLRGILGICGVALLLNVCLVSNVEYRSEALPLVLVWLTLAGGGYGTFIRLFGLRLRSDSCLISVADRPQFTITQFMIVTAATCGLLIFMRRYGEMPLHIVGEIIYGSAFATVFIAMPTIVAASFAAIVLSPKTTTVQFSSNLGILCLAATGAGIVLAIGIPFIVDTVFLWSGREVCLWLVETPIHMLLAMWLFRWMGWRLVSQSDE